MKFEEKYIMDQRNLGHILDFAGIISLPVGQQTHHSFSCYKVSNNAAAFTFTLLLTHASGSQFMEYSDQWHQ